MLIILLVEAMHCVWILEQPAGSNDILPLHPRVSWLFNEILYASRLCWLDRSALLSAVWW